MSRRLKILIAGEWQGDIHDRAWADGLSSLGHVIVPFGWYDLFHSATNPLYRLRLKAESRLLAGPTLIGLNRRLLIVAEAESPDVVLLFRATHIFSATVEALKRRSPRMLLATYNADDPFSPKAAAGLWRHFRSALRWTDVNLAHRHKNLDDLRRIGARGIHLVRAAYIPAKHRPIEVSNADFKKFGSDVVFAGHFEPDGRMGFLRAVAEAGFNLRLFGPDWDRAQSEPWLERLRPIQSARGEDYTKAIQCSKVALCFLSGLNNDTYATRCFEIPAIGTLLLCQRTTDVEGLLTPGVDADYFSTPSELVERIALYLGDEAARTRVATAGRAKVQSAGHDMVSRMREVERIFLDALDEAG